MTPRGALLAITAVAIALVMSGCDDMTVTDDVSTALPHHGTWYFADPNPDDAIPLPPDARLVLTETEFTLAMGDGMETFTLFDVPNVTTFEVTGTYTIGADGSASLSLPNPLEVAVVVKPYAAKTAIEAAVNAVAAELPADSSPVVMFDLANPEKVTISWDFLPALLDLPGVTEVTACKGAPCASS